MVTINALVKTSFFDFLILFDLTAVSYANIIALGLSKLANKPTSSSNAPPGIKNCRTKLHESRGRVNECFQ